MASGYTPKILEQVDEYIAMKKDEYFDYQKTVGERSNSFERKVKVNFPTVEDFARSIGVPKSTLYDWKRDNIELSDSLGKIVALQKQRLIEGGLSGDYNSTIAKMLLSANHGVVEVTKVENKTIHYDVANMTDEELLELAKSND